MISGNDMNIARNAEDDGNFNQDFTARFIQNYIWQLPSTTVLHLLHPSFDIYIFFHLYASRVDKNVSKRSCKIRIQLLEIAF